LPSFAYKFCLQEPSLIATVCCPSGFHRPTRVVATTRFSYSSQGHSQSCLFPSTRLNTRCATRSTVVNTYHKVVHRVVKQCKCVDSSQLFEIKCAYSSQKMKTNQLVIDKSRYIKISLMLIFLSRVGSSFYPFFAGNRTSCSRYVRMSRREFELRAETRAPFLLCSR